MTTNTVENPVIQEAIRFETRKVKSAEAIRSTLRFENEAEIYNAICGIMKLCKFSMRIKNSLELKDNLISNEELEATMNVALKLVPSTEISFLEDYKKILED